MRVGGWRVIDSLINAPKMSIRGLLSLLPRLIKRQGEAEAFRFYVTDCLQIMAENTAKFAGGRYMTMRFADIVDPPKEDTRTPEEIIEKIKKGLDGA